MDQFFPATFLLLTAVSGFAQTPKQPSGQPTLNFMQRSYRLGSYNQKSNPMWEFVSNGETVDNWTTLITVIDRPDARTLPDLDRLAQGIMDQYKSVGGQILMAKSMRNDAGATFNYLLAAFEEPARRRFELNFVKIALGPRNAYTMVCGVRIEDPKDYQAKAKEFLTRHSGELGKAVGDAVPPDIGSLPRKVF